MLIKAKNKMHILKRETKELAEALCKPMSKRRTKITNDDDSFCNCKKCNEIKTREGRNKESGNQVVSE
jgi:hypothetical protein